MGGTLQKVTVSRSSAEELARGIEELEKRGYVVKSLHEKEEGRKLFSRVDKKYGSKFVFDTCTSNTKHIAIMTRIWHG